MSEQRWLVVDDDVPFAETLQRLLAKSGDRVDVAQDGDSALQIARRLQPGRIVLDMKLGEMSGLQLIQPLLEAVPEARIVMLTGYASIPTAVSAIKQGAWNFVMKPIDLSSLKAAFEESAQLPGEQDDVMSPKRIEWEHIQRVLVEHEGNISATARALGMHRRTLQRKLQKKPVAK